MRTNEEMFQELDEFIESLNYDKTELIAILHRAQHIFGYLPMVVQTHIAKKLKIKNGETTYDGKFSLTTLRCVGACGLAPVMTVNDVVHPAMTPDKAMEVIYSLKVKEESK